MGLVTRVAAILVALVGLTCASAAHAAAVYGKIGEKYAALGGEGGPLGRALTDEASLPYGGRFNLFEHGIITWHPDIGAFALTGAIADKYNAVGRAETGYPTSDLLPTSDGRGAYVNLRSMKFPPQPTGTLPLQFKYVEASIYHSPRTGASLLYGAIRDKWLEMGAERSPVGYPVGDEMPGEFGGRVQAFESGFIAWHPDTGVHAVYGEIGKKWAALGRERFGYPTTDEQEIQYVYGRFNHFKAVQLAGKPEATIYFYDANYGAHAVYGSIRADWVRTIGSSTSRRIPTSDEYDWHGFRRQDFANGNFYLYSRSIGTRLISAPVTAPACISIARHYLATGAVPAGWVQMHDQGDVLAACSAYMGYDAQCEAKGMRFSWADNSNQPAMICVNPYHADSVWQQGEALFTQAILPNIGLAISGTACLSGTIFACGLLATDIANRVGVPGMDNLPQVVTLANQSLSCAGGELTECAQLGLYAAGKAGLSIPGFDLDLVNTDLEACRNGLWAACLRLGMYATDAAGVPAVGDAVADGLKCADGAADACIRLGKKAAAAGVPLGGIFDAADLANRCRNGDDAACNRLAGISGTADLALRCRNGDDSACRQLAGIPNAADLAVRCQNGDDAACRQLGGQIVSAVGANTLRAWSRHNLPSTMFAETLRRNGFRAATSQVGQQVLNSPEARTGAPNVLHALGAAGAQNARTTVYQSMNAAPAATPQASAAAAATATQAVAPPPGAAQTLRAAKVSAAQAIVATPAPPPTAAAAQGVLASPPPPTVNPAVALAARTRVRYRGLAPEDPPATVSPSEAAAALVNARLTSRLAELADSDPVQVGERTITAAEARRLVLALDDGAIINVDGSMVPAANLKRSLAR
jgi:hypothetical protein